MASYISGRSREGAWIEMTSTSNGWKKTLTVAPARERGLKFQLHLSLHLLLLVAPARERGLKLFAVGISEDTTARRSREGAWIEIVLLNLPSKASLVAPARERGLKFISPVTLILLT